MRARKASNLTEANAFRVPQIAARNNVGVYVVNLAIRSGALRASKLGDAPRSPIVITREAEAEWLESRRIRPQPEAAEAA